MALVLGRNIMLLWVEVYAHLFNIRCLVEEMIPIIFLAFPHTTIHFGS